uniref:Uncharacterized protein n=1 Tax=Triticum urartu TaxID=4572 RepID=A0A8R7VKT2_TRIUA
MWRDRSLDPRHTGSVRSSSLSIPWPPRRRESSSSFALSPPPSRGARTPFGHWVSAMRHGPGPPHRGTTPWTSTPPAWTPSSWPRGSSSRSSSTSPTGQSLPGLIRPPGPFDGSVQVEPGEQA